MHELSLAEAVVEQLEDVMRQQDEPFTKIERIVLEIGAMSGVEKEPFAFAFPVVSQGTVAEEATLVFVEVPVAVYCRTCLQTTEPEYPLIVCMSCNSTDVDVVAGRDFKIMSMEVS